MNQFTPIEIRIEKFVSRTFRSIGGCLIWSGQRDKVTGYGRSSLDGKTQWAHRVAYQLFVGKIPIGKMVLHSCDVRLCVEKKHLYVGTHAKNTSDMVERKRTRRGENHHQSKLTKDDVVEIRALHTTLSTRKLATKYGVSQTNIRFIISRKTWGWVR